MKRLAHFTESRATFGSARVYESPYCKVIAKGHPETIVSFAAINCPPGKFLTSRVFAKIPENVVFLNCPRNSWYVDGIPGLGDGIESSAEGLLAVLDEAGLAHTRKLFWGGSMGGFGAVAFGALANADQVVATGAELKLLVEGGNSELIMKKRQRRTDIPSPPIAAWLERSKCHVHLYCGEFAYHDLVSAKEIIANARVRITTLRNFGHPLPGYLEEVYGLHAFLKAHSPAGGSFPFSRGEPGLMTQFTDWWEDLHAVAMNLGTSAEVRIRAGLEGEAGLPPEMAAHCAYALSCGASHREDHEAAITFARSAIEMAGPDCFPTHRLAKALQAAGSPHEVWTRAAREVADFPHWRWFEFAEKTVEMIAAGYVDAGDMNGLADYLADQRRRSVDQPKRLDLLDELAGNIVELPSWQVRLAESCSARFIRCTLDKNQVENPSKVLMISGTVLANSAAGQIAEPSMDPKIGRIVRFRMNHESPGVAKMRPDLPHAARARFKIEFELNPPLMDSFEIRGTTADGSIHEWLKFAR